MTGALTLMFRWRVKTMRRITLVAVGSWLALACGGDTQTESQVATTTPGGEKSTSMSGDSADKRGVALVRVVNAAGSVSNVTVRADEMRALPSVDYKSVTPYQSIDRNWATFQITSGSGGAYAPLETNREMLSDGRRYTIVVMNEDDGTGFTTRILRDEISEDMTKAHLRVIHAAPGLDEIDVVARGGETLFDGVNHSAEAGFRDVNPWNGTLEVRAEDGERALVTVPNANLKAGTSYTLVVTRASAKGKLEAFLFEDQPVRG